MRSGNFRLRITPKLSERTQRPFFGLLARDGARSVWQGSGAVRKIRHLVFITKGNLASLKNR
jgi:hypothetical protein